MILILQWVKIIGKKFKFLLIQIANSVILDAFVLHPFAFYYLNTYRNGITASFQRNNLIATYMCNLNKLLKNLVL